MHIERVQIEEGFLDGLDVSFSRGLNVVIGERGTGKTSLIELMRFCLGVEGYTSESTQRSLDHALSVLGSGQITVTLADGDRRLLVTRTGGDDSPRASDPFVRPIILSQTEIETVGLQAQGRLRLLDSFVGDQRDAIVQEAAAASEVRSLTVEAESFRREIEELAERAQEVPSLERQISDLAPKEQELAKVSAEAKEKKVKLDAMSGNIAASSVGAGALERFQATVSRWQSLLSTAASRSPSVEPWPAGAGPDPLIRAREAIRQAQKHLDAAMRELDEVLTDVQSHLQSSLDHKLKIEDRTRQLRRDIDALQEGAGAIIRQGQQLREKKARLDSLKTVLVERRRELQAIFARRSSALDRLDKIRENRFFARNQAATALAETLGPRIRVKASRAGQFEKFAAAIADVLRGSGLRYNELSPMLAKSVSPRELLEAADSNDIDLISEAAGITRERATRALVQLRNSDLGALATVAVEDTVSLQLLDGTTYKGIGELSTGQRCTVVLPLVLRHNKRILVVDQPEDHIDNAFIADTLIVSLIARSPDSQVIFSTHNANIPVLGNADRIIQLGSDGRRGYVILAADLKDERIVKAITRVMEGGAEAFKRRASFYGHHGAS